MSNETVEEIGVGMLGGLGGLFDLTEEELESDVIGFDIDGEMTDEEMAELQEMFSRMLTGPDPRSAEHAPTNTTLVDDDENVVLDTLTIKGVLVALRALADSMPMGYATLVGRPNPDTNVVEGVLELETFWTTPNIETQTIDALDGVPSAQDHADADADGPGFMPYVLL